MTEAPPPPPGDDDASGATPPPAAAPPPAAPPPAAPPPAAPPPAQPAGYPPPPPPPAAPAPGYGAPQQPGYAQPAYGAAAAPVGELATWVLRAQGALVDWLGPVVVADIVYFAISRPLGTVLQLLAFAWTLYQAYQGGATGQSLGKKMAGIRLLSEQTGQVIGGGLGIGRAFLHILDALPCYLGFLWPLWDAKRQTFADKIVHTVVVKV